MMACGFISQIDPYWEYILLSVCILLQDLNMFGADLPYNMYIQEEESKVNDGWNFDLEDYLAPHSQVPHPWNRQSTGETHLDMDFILVAEFSELEGPREVVCVEPYIHIVTLLS